MHCLFVWLNDVLVVCLVIACVTVFLCFCALVSFCGVWFGVSGLLSKGLWVVRGGQKRAQDLGLSPTISPPPAPAPSATFSLRTCFVPHHHRRVFGQHINANIVRCRPSTNEFLPTPTALKLKLMLLGAILAGNSIFTDPTHLSDKRNYFYYTLTYIQLA